MEETNGGGAGAQQADGEAPDRRIDPVREAAEYQAHLLGLLGDRDAAEVQRQLGPRLASLVRGAGQDLRTRPEPGEWSVVECLGHMVDAEIVYAGRYRWILAHERPPLIGYDQDLWVERLGHQDADPEELLGFFDVLREANLALWERTTERERERVGMHAERGPESFDLSFRLIAGHGLFHLAQIDRTLERVRAARHERAARPAGPPAASPASGS
jgi:hypothetical protein